MPSNPFIYPKARHKRRETPPAYSSYRKYKPFLKKEFSSQCVYCRLPDGIQREDTFGVDHYRPQSKFPELAATYTNLFYVCNCCNRRKANFWPTQAQERKGEFIPNACDHVMFEHLQYRFSRVETKSDAGRIANKYLDFNDEKSVQYREFILRIITGLEQDRREHQKAIQAIRQRAESNPENIEQLEQAKADAERELEEIERDLARVIGSALG